MDHEITGNMLLGAASVRGTQGTLRAFAPASGQELEPEFGAGGAEDVDRACRLAAEAFDPYRQAALDTRAALLEGIATRIEALGATLIERLHQETALPVARLEGERARTCGQLRLFAKLVRDGRWNDATLDSAQPERKPLPRSDLRARKIPDRPGSRVRRQQFPAGLLGGGRRHRLGAGRRLPGGGQGARGAPGRLGTGGPRDPADGGRAGPARRHLLAGDRQGQHGRRGAGRASGHQVGGLHRLAARRPRAVGDRRGARRADPRACRNEQHQPGGPDAGRVEGARHADRTGLRRFADARRRPVLHQSRPGAGDLGPRSRHLRGRCGRRARHAPGTGHAVGRHRRHLSAPDRRARRADRRRPGGRRHRLGQCLQRAARVVPHYRGGVRGQSRAGRRNLRADLDRGVVPRRGGRSCCACWRASRAS